MGGVGNRQIAERAGCTPTWARRIIHRFKDDGTEAIEWYPYYCRRGGPRKSLAELAEPIAEIALSPPKQLIGMSVWSLSKLRAYLIERKIVPSVSPEWLRQVVRQRRVCWRHTQTWKESHNPAFWLKYRRIRRLYARSVRGGVRLSVDEFGPLNLLPRHGRHYGRIGHVDRLWATYKRTGGVRHVFGVYDLDRDAGTLPIVLKNVAYHRTPEILAYAAANGIRFYGTPTDASWLNRIECHFRAMKEFALDNTD